MADSSSSDVDQRHRAGNGQRQREEVSSCDLCGARQFSPELAVQDWRLVRCCECGLVCTSPRYTEREIEKLYFEAYYQVASRYFESQLHPATDDDLRIARKLRNMLRETQRRHLDVGCGTGALVEAFGLLGFSAKGIEPNKMAADAGQSFGRNISTLSLSEVATNSQDCITAFHVLEHAYSPKGFLLDCNRILSDGGLIAVEVPNYASRSARKLKERWQPLYPDTHLYQFTPETLQRLLELTGFEVLSISKVGGGGFEHAPTRKPTASDEAVRSPINSSTITSAVLRSLWNSRKLIYRIPRSREVIRYIYWQVLDRGEFIRVLAKKQPPNR